MQQQFTQPGQAQFFDANHAAHPQENFQLDQQMMQQLGSLVPRGDENRQQQMMQQHLQQFCGSQAAMFDANKNYQSMLAQQNMRPISSAQSLQGQNQAISAPGMQQNLLQSLMPNNKNFYGQQLIDQRQQPNSQLDMNQMQ